MLGRAALWLVAAPLAMLQRSSADAQPDLFCVVTQKHNTLCSGAYPAAAASVSATHKSMCSCCASAAVTMYVSDADGDEFTEASCLSCCEKQGGACFPACLHAAAELCAQGCGMLTCVHTCWSWKRQGAVHGLPMQVCLPINLEDDGYNMVHSHDNSAAFILAGECSTY